MSKAGFNLRYWTSNIENVRNLAKDVLDSDEHTKILGMRWYSKSDECFFPKKVKISTHLVTKREILKQSSAIYGTLGLLSPVTIRAKMALQEL